MKAAYDPHTASLTAELSKKAYEKSHIDIGGTQVLFYNGSDRVVIAFRGTEINPTDIFTDVYAFFNKDGVHSGFHNAYDKVHDEIVSVIDNWDDKEIYLTGHSLGGALATLAASRLERPNLMACYTFGSPRVGDADMDSKTKCPVYRFVNHHDVVPRLPILAMGYRHVGDLRYLTKKGKVVRCPSSLITELFFALNLFRGLKHTIDDHSIEEYVSKLNEEEKEQRK